MNEFDKARREILAALLVEYHRSEGGLTDSEDLAKAYCLKARETWFDPIISEVEHFLIVSRTYDGVAARIHPRGYGTILRETLENLNASQLEIDPRKEEILSDATDYDWFPVPTGWKWFQFAQDGTIERADSLAEPIDSSSWTGLPATFVLTEEKRQSLVRELDRAEDALATLNISQEVRSQARAYIVAARVLAEAPEPPAELIWQLVSRANSLAGIASLFIAIVGLFV